MRGLVGSCGGTQFTGPIVEPDTPPETLNRSVRMRTLQAAAAAVKWYEVPFTERGGPL